MDGSVQLTPVEELLQDLYELHELGSDQINEHLSEAIDEAIEPIKEFCRQGLINAQLTGKALSSQQACPPRLLDRRLELIAFDRRPDDEFSALSLTQPELRIVVEVDQVLQQIAAMRALQPLFSADDISSSETTAFQLYIQAKLDQTKFRGLRNKWFSQNIYPVLFERRAADLLRAGRKRGQVWSANEQLFGLARRYMLTHMACHYQQL
jgi:hypothetical protein